MGRYFGREPHYSQQEAEAQAREAIDAAVKKGRPPADEWKGLASRMGEINRELAARPPVEAIPSPPPRRADTERASAGRPRVVSDILRPRPAPAPEPAPAPAPAKRAPRASASAAPAPAPAKRAKRAAEPAKPAAVKRAAPRKRS